MEAGSHQQDTDNERENKIEKEYDYVKTSIQGDLVGDRNSKIFRLERELELLKLEKRAGAWEETLLEGKAVGHERGRSAMDDELFESSNDDEQEEDTHAVEEGHYSSPIWKTDPKQDQVLKAGMGHGKTESYFCPACGKGPFKRWKYMKAHQIKECADKQGQVLDHDWEEEWRARQQQRREEDLLEWRAGKEQEQDRVVQEQTEQQEEQERIWQQIKQRNGEEKRRLEEDVDHRQAVVEQQRILDMIHRAEEERRREEELSMSCILQMTEREQALSPLLIKTPSTSRMEQEGWKEVMRRLPRNNLSSSEWPSPRSTVAPGPCINLARAVCLAPSSRPLASLGSKLSPHNGRQETEARARETWRQETRPIKVNKEASSSLERQEDHRRAAEKVVCIHHDVYI